MAGTVAMNVLDAAYARETLQRPTLTGRGPCRAGGPYHSTELRRSAQSKL